MFIFRQRNLNYFVTILRNHFYFKKRFIIYTQANIIMVMMSKGMRWITNVALKGELRNRKKIVVGKPERNIRL
jgi:hypothetical protein